MLSSAITFANPNNPNNPNKPVIPLHPVVSHADAKAWCEALYFNAGMNVSDSLIRDCTKIVMHNGYIVVIIDIG